MPKSKSKSKSYNTNANTKSILPKSTSTTLPKSTSTTLPSSPSLPLLSRSTTTLLTPLLAATSLPKTLASTLYTGLKSLTHPVATAIGLRKKRPRRSRTAKMFANVQRHEDLDEWEEIDRRAVREEMREERARRKRLGMGMDVGVGMELGESEEEREGEGEVRVRREEKVGEEVHPLQKPGRKRFRRWDDSEEEGEVIEINGVPVGNE